MSKKFSHKSDQYSEYDDGQFENYSGRDALHQHRKEKRLKNALRTNNISDLMDLDDEY